MKGTKGKMASVSNRNGANKEESPYVSSNDPLRPLHVSADLTLAGLQNSDAFVGEHVEHVPHAQPWRRRWDHENNTTFFCSHFFSTMLTSPLSAAEHKNYCSRTLKSTNNTYWAETQSTMRKCRTSMQGKTLILIYLLARRYINFVVEGVGTER